MPIIGVIDSSKLKSSAGDFESIATASSAGVSTVTFSSIPSTYKMLQIRFAIYVTGANINLRCNGVTSNSYDYGITATYSTGGTLYAQTAYGVNLYAVDGGWQASDGSYPSVGVIDILDYASTSKVKTIKTLTGCNINGSSGGSVLRTDGVFQSTSAISSLTLFTSGGANMSSATNIALYGIK